MFQCNEKRVAAARRSARHRYEIDASEGRPCRSGLPTRCDVHRIPFAPKGSSPSSRSACSTPRANRTGRCVDQPRRCGACRTGIAMGPTRNRLVTRPTTRPSPVAGLYRHLQQFAVAPHPTVRARRVTPRTCRMSSEFFVGSRVLVRDASVCAAEGSNAVDFLVAQCERGQIEVLPLPRRGSRFR